MKPANNAETAAATHAKEDARCREEGARKREREWRRLRRVRRFAWITLLSEGSPSLLFVPDTDVDSFVDGRKSREV